MTQKALNGLPIFIPHRPVLCILSACQTDVKSRAWEHITTLLKEAWLHHTQSRSQTNLWGTLNSCYTLDLCRLAWDRILWLINQGIDALFWQRCQKWNLIPHIQRGSITLTLTPPASLTSLLPSSYTIHSIIRICSSFFLSLDIYTLIPSHLLDLSNCLSIFHGLYSHVHELPRRTPRLFALPYFSPYQYHYNRTFWTI